MRGEGGVPDNASLLLPSTDSMLKMEVWLTGALSASVKRSSVILWGNTDTPSLTESLGEGKGRHNREVYVCVVVMPTGKCPPQRVAADRSRPPRTLRWWQCQCGWWCLCPPLSLTTGGGGESGLQHLPKHKTSLIGQQPISRGVEWCNFQLCI